MVSIPEKKDVPLWRKARRSVPKKRYSSIQEYAAALIQAVHYRDEDGRDIGYDYGVIRKAVLRRFPVVRTTGPHQGNATRMSYKELWELSCDLNRKGVKLPFRPRRRHSAKKTKAR